MSKFSCIKNGILAASVLASLCLGSVAALGATFAVDNSPLTDFIVPDVCANSSGAVVPGDPYACPSGSTKRNLRVGDEIPYVLGRTPAAGEQKPDTVYIAFPAADAQGNVMLVNLLDNKGSVSVGGKKLSTGLFDLDLLNDTYGVISWSGDSKTYSSVETRGSKGPNGWMTTGCRSADSWVMFPKSFVPFAEPDNVYTLSSLQLANIPYTDRIKSKSDYGTWMYRLPPLERRPDGLYRGATKLCDSTGQKTNFTKSKAFIRYGSTRGYKFESGKVIDSIWEEHYYQDPQLANAKHHDRLGMEKVFYTREYGNSRWETWQSDTTIAAKCADDDDAEGCASARIQSALSDDRNGCPKSGEAKMTIEGVTMYRVSCSDRTTVMPIPNKLRSLPVEPRVYHLSRQLFGANQNWVLNGDFAGGNSEGWQADKGVQNLTAVAQAVTQNSRLAVTCTNNCSVTASRQILTNDPAYGTEEVMTAAERDKLTWLKAIDAGISVESAASSTVNATLTVRFLDANNKVVAQKAVDGGLAPGESKRLKLAMPFTQAALNQSSRVEMSLSMAGANNSVYVDEAYILPMP